MFKRVLIATDGTELSQSAIAEGVSLAKASGGEVIAVHATPHVDARVFFAEDVMIQTDADHVVEQHVAAAADRALAVVQAAADEAGVKCEAIHRRDDPAEGILAVADEKACDLIVMASHGRRGFARLLLGSETTKVLTFAKVPVLVTR
jgi:nucleotide-binding universal stress UspA family protein